MFRDLTIRTRIIAVIAICLFQLVLVSVIGIRALGQTNATIKTIYDDRVVALGLLDRVIRSIDQVETIVANAATGDAAQLSEALKKIDQQREREAKAWGDYMATYLTEEEKVLAQAFGTARKAYLEGGVAQAREAMRGGDLAATLSALHGPMAKQYEPVQATMDKLIALQLDVAGSEYARSQEDYASTRLLSIIVCVVGFIVSAAIGGWLLVAISRPLEQALDTAASVAAGDLTRDIEVNSNDEMGQLMTALKEMNNSLIGIVAQVRSGTDTIATASSQIAAGNLDLSSRTEEQASSLEETASSMEELTSTVKQNAENARQAETLARTAADVATKGGEVVSMVVTTMDEINASASQIEAIIGVIDGIAFQTNILALNAAVEAARAGEQGRGFAVVATEVRTLAQRSANAAKEIKELINTSVERVNTGSKLVDAAGARMTEIVASIQRVSSVVDEITVASAEQASGIEQVNMAITQMDHVTQQNASLVEEAADAADSLQSQAGKLRDLVSVFKLPAHGGRALR